MEVKKTRREWFATLPEPYQSQAIENAIEHGKKFKVSEDSVMDTTANSLTHSLITGFIFDGTPEEQGRDYWMNFYLPLKLQGK